MSNTNERRWLWWVLGVLVLGLAASFFFFQSTSGPTTIGNSGAERTRLPFPKSGALPEVPLRSHVKPAQRLAPDPKFDRGQSK
jgi:hypothetical protein